VTLAQKGTKFQRSAPDWWLDPTQQLLALKTPLSDESGCSRARLAVLQARGRQRAGCYSVTAQTPVFLQMSLFPEEERTRKD